jgi:hypothetical protein
MTEKAGAGQFDRSPRLIDALVQQISTRGLDVARTNWALPSWRWTNSLVRARGGTRRRAGVK